jgi:hypothetical protein
MSTCAWTHRVARLRGWKPNSCWTRIWLGLGFSNSASNLGLVRGIYIREGGGAARWSCHRAAADNPPRSRLLLLADLAVRRCNASSPYVWDTLEVLHLEHKDEPHERDDPWAEGGHDGWPHNCMSLLRCIRLHRVTSVAPACLVVIPLPVTSSRSWFMRSKF